MQNADSQASGSGSVGVRGASRVLSSALRSAGIRGGGGGEGEGMDVDGGVGRAGGRHKRTGARSAGPLDQSGRRKDTPYNKPNGKPLSSRISGLNPPTGGAGPGGKKKSGGRPNDPRRNPQGTPDILRDDSRKTSRVRREQHTKLTDLLKSEAIKEWLRSRCISPGVVDMSNLPNDPWLKEHGILPPGHKDAAPNTGTLFWSLINSVLQTPEQPIHTLSLASNNFYTLSQLSKLPHSLPYIRALDLSNNPIQKSEEFKHLQSHGEAQGKASVGAGSLKSLTELKLNGVRFREEMSKKENGWEEYQHDILRRFPGLLILDGTHVSRVVFPVERKPIPKRDPEERKALAARPFTYPFDIKPSFDENPAVKEVVMQFCQKFFELFDKNRGEVVYGYHPEASISVAPNTLPSRSYQAGEVPRAARTSKPISWNPGRNFLRTCTTIEQRTRSLKSPLDMDALLRWWNKELPRTEHPLTDSTKWCIDAWYFDTNQDRIAATIQGEFMELPARVLRSFTRTFILGAPAPDSTAAARGWPCTILSDTLVVHSYLGTRSWDSRSSLAVGDVTIVPPVLVVPAAPVTSPVGAGGVGVGVANPEAQKAALVEAVRQRTGMNAQFSEMCLAQNDWDVERAVANFAEIRASIPPEAFV